MLQQPRAEGLVRLRSTRLAILGVEGLERHALFDQPTSTSAARAARSGHRAIGRNGLEPLTPDPASYTRSGNSGLMSVGMCAVLANTVRSASSSRA